MRHLIWALGIGTFASVAPAFGKDLVVKVDARSAPWSTGANPNMRFGLADARPPMIVFDSSVIAGVRVTLVATGSTTTFSGGASFGPRGDTSWSADRGMALFPSRYIKSKKPVYLNQLVGAFVSADGTVVGEPFAIGDRAEVRAPDGAAGLSLGLNDDRYSDNSGFLTVKIHVVQGIVTVEPADADQ